MLKISIPAPCHQDWDGMRINEQGRYCTACSKTVIDFTAMNDDELRNFFLHKKEDKICGRFSGQQLNRQIDLPSNIFQIPMNWWKRFLVASLIVFGSTLFSCNTTIKGDIATKDFIIRDSVIPGKAMPSPPNTILGAFAIPIITETIEDTQCFTGDVILVNTDSGELPKETPVISPPFQDSVKINFEEVMLPAEKTIVAPGLLNSKPDSLQTENPPKADSIKTNCDSLSIIYS